MAIVVPTPNTTITSAWGKSVADALNAVPPGAELHYSQITANVASTANTTAAAVVVLPGAAVTYDGTPVLVTFQSPVVSNTTSSAITYLSLWVDGTDMGILGATSLSPTGAPNIPVSLARRFSPAAGSHTLSVRMWVSSGSATVSAGVGGAGAYLPAFLRVTKA